MRICFIGSNGFLATTFGKLFDNADVYGTSAPKNYDYKYFCEFDVRNTNFGFDVFLKYDFIFLFSALGVQSGEANSSKDIFRVNTFFPIELFNYLSENHFQGILTTFGSYFEIGNNNQEIAFDEVDIINSNLKVPNDYCLSKRLLTKYIDSKKSSIHNWHFILPTIYGNGENSNRLIPYIINAISKKKKLILHRVYK